MIIRSGEITHGQAVAFGLFAKEIDSRYATGAGHVLHDDRGIAGNVLGEMACDDSPFDVGRPAGAEIY